MSAKNKSQKKRYRKRIEYSKKRKENTKEREQAHGTLVSIVSVLSVGDPLLHVNVSDVGEEKESKEEVKKEEGPIKKKRGRKSQNNNNKACSFFCFLFSFFF